MGARGRSNAGRYTNGGGKGQIQRFQAFLSPRQSGGPKGCLRRLHFMRPFAPCFGKLVAGAQVYLVRRREQGVHDRGGGVPCPLSCDVNQPSTRVSNSCPAALHCAAMTSIGHLPHRPFRVMRPPKQRPSTCTRHTVIHTVHKLEMCLPTGQQDLAYDSAQLYKAIHVNRLVRMGEW